MVKDTAKEVAEKVKSGSGSGGGKDGKGKAKGGGGNVDEFKMEFTDTGTFSRSKI